MDNVSNAFPMPGYTAPGGDVTWPADGMTTRLYAAIEMAKALVAVAPFQAVPREALVEEAYKYADALIVAQNKEF